MPVWARTHTPIGRQLEEARPKGCARRARLRDPRLSAHFFEQPPGWDRAGGHLAGAGARSFVGGRMVTVDATTEDLGARPSPGQGSPEISIGLPIEISVRDRPCRPARSQPGDGSRPKACARSNLERRRLAAEGVRALSRPPARAQSRAI